MLFVLNEDVDLIMMGVVSFTYSKSKLGYSVKKLVPKQFYEKCVVKHTLKLRKKSSITEPVGNMFFSHFYIRPIFSTNR